MRFIFHAISSFNNAGFDLMGGGMNGSGSYITITGGSVKAAAGENANAIGCSLIVSPTSEVLVNAKNDQGAVFAQIDIQAARYYKSLCPIAEIE